MNEPGRERERGLPARSAQAGASILASLVIVAMLGGAALVADLASTPRVSQTAATIVHVEPPPRAVTDLAKTKTPASFEEQQAKACQERIKSSARKGAPDNVPRVTITKKKGESASSADEGTGKRKEADGSEAIVDLCISIFTTASYSEATKHDDSSYECRGRLAKVSIDTAGTATSASSPYKISPQGQCKTIECKPDPGNPEKVECIVGDSSGDTLRDAGKFPKDALKIKLDKDDFESKGIGTTLNEQENDALQAALEGAEERHTANAAEVKSKADAYEKALQDLAECKGCSNKSALEQAAKSAEKELDVAEKKYGLSREELDRLKTARVALNATEGPPSKKEDDAGKGECPPNCGPSNPDPGPGGQSPGGGSPSSTFPPLGGQPPPGNQTPHAPGTCYGGQTICQGNTLYSRNNQCVDTPVQYCQYGCAQSSGSSGFLGFFGAGTQSGRCAPPPQQGQNCPPPPVQPQQPCQGGTWRPTYGGQNNSCVSGWQCVPGGGALLTAQLTCEPQIADVGMTIAITYSCSSGTSVGSGFQTGGVQTGSTTVTIANPPLDTNVATYGLTCTDQGATASKQCSVQIAKPAIVLVANPKSIPSGTTSAIGWVTSGMRSCVISSPDLSSFTEQHKNTMNVNGAVVTPPLSSSATFVLTCITLGGGSRTASTTVAIL